MRVAKDPIAIDVASESDEENTEIKPDSLNESATADAVSGELLACRACLSTDVKLFNIYECSLDATFGEFTGVPVSPQDGLPQHLCYWCRALLKKSAAFRGRCQSTQYYLQNIYVWTSRLTTQDIRWIDKENLILPLIRTMPLIIDYLGENNAGGKDFSNAKDIKEHTGCLDKIQIHVTPSPNSNTEGVEITKNTINTNVNQTRNSGSGTKVSAAMLTTVKIEDITNETSSDDVTDTENLTFLNDVETLSESEDGTNEEVKKETPKSSPATLDASEMNAMKSEEDLEKFSATYNVDILHLSVKEQLEELSVIRKTESFINSEYKCDSCCRIFKDGAAFQNHMKRHDNSYGDLECKICKLHFIRKSHLCGHVRNTHNTLRLKCRACGCITKHRRAAINHHKTHKGEKAFVCADCPERFRSRTAHATHVQQYHATRRCGKCGETFKGSKALADHKIVHEQVHKCSICNVGFRSSDALEKHQCGKIPCVSCGECFQTEEQLNKHTIDIHQARKCVECSFTCSNLRKLDRHYANEHKGKKRPGKKKRETYRSKDCVCDICAKVVKSNVFKAHLRTHSNEKPHQCKFCEKRFAKKWHLREHENKHTGQRPLKCPECPATFSSYDEKTKHKKTVHLNKMFQCRKCKVCLMTQSNLEAHERTHSRIKPYQCDLCKVRYLNKSTLEMHIANHGKHTGNPIYKCSYCPERFTTSYGVQRHRAKVHVRETYQCDICGKVFSMKITLIAHLKRHTEEQSYKCTLCPRAYSKKSTLTEHMNMHTGAKPFKCSLCPKTFSRHWMRYEHRMRVHLKKPVKKGRVKQATGEKDIM